MCGKKVKQAIILAAALNTVTSSRGSHALVVKLGGQVAKNQEIRAEHRIRGGLLGAFRNQVEGHQSQEEHL